MQADGPGGRWGGEGSAGGRGPLKYALLRRSQGEYSRPCFMCTLVCVYLCEEDLLGPPSPSGGERESRNTRVGRKIKELLK